jgi:DNA-binding transcriptional LysR family regulator
MTLRDGGWSAPVELGHLRYFVAVAEELHYGRAARRLHMAQPPLSQAILHLERELGAELVTRDHRVVGLTDAGEIFLEHARRILIDVGTATRAAQRAARRETGQIRVGFVSEATPALLPNALRDLSVRVPGVSVALFQATTGEQLTRLHDREIDVAVIRGCVATS